MALIGCAVSLIVLDRCCGEGGLEVADPLDWRRGAALLAAATLQRGGLGLGGEVELAYGPSVIDLDQVGTCACLLERLGDHHRDRLVIVLDIPATEQVRRVVLAEGQLGHVQRRHHREHARRRLRPLDVHRADTPFGDARAQDMAVGLVRRDVVPFVRVGGSAANLAWTIDAVGWPPDDLELIDRVAAFGLVELHGLTLCFGEHRGERALDQRQLERVVLRRHRALE